MSKTYKDMPGYKQFLTKKSEPKRYRAKKGFSEGSRDVERPTQAKAYGPNALSEMKKDW